MNTSTRTSQVAISESIHKRLHSIYGLPGQNHDAGVAAEAQADQSQREEQVRKGKRLRTLSGPSVRITGVQVEVDKQPRFPASPQPSPYNLPGCPATSRLAQASHAPGPHLKTHKPDAVLSFSSLPSPTIDRNRSPTACATTADCNRFCKALYQPTASSLPYIVERAQMEVATTGSTTTLLPATRSTQ